jgi:hypothetical protein
MRNTLNALVAVLACAAVFGCGEVKHDTAKNQADRPARKSTPRAAEAKSEPVASGVPFAAPAREASSRGPADEGPVRADVRAAPAPGKPATGSHKSNTVHRESEPGRVGPEEPGRHAPARKDMNDTTSLRLNENPAESEERAVPQHDRHSIQSGTLTAGSFDDHEHFEDYRRFVSETMQGDAAEVLPRLAIGQRVMIHVTGAGGRPVGDARVVICVAEPQVATGILPARNASTGDTPVAPSVGDTPVARVPTSGPALLETSTGSDGRALFLTGLNRGAGSSYQVSVFAPGSSQPVTQVMQVDQQPWRIALAGAAAPLPRRLDLALVVDTTGSMGDELEYLKVEIDSIAAAVHRMFPNVDQRYALVVYRDEGDEYVTRTFDFTGSLEDFRGTLSRQRATGGGDEPEAVHLALQCAAKLDWRDRETARVMFLVGDAPPHDRFGRETVGAVEALRARGVRIYPVAASGAKLKAEFVMRSAALSTLGQYLFLTDHSGVGNPHAKPHVPSYQVEHLDRLMIRMIASELAGRRLAPKEVIAIEGGASPGDLPILPEQQTQTRVQGQPPATVPAARAGLSFWPPHWALLVGAILLMCVVDSVIDRAEAR